MNDVPARLIVKRGPNPDEEYLLSEAEVTIGRSSSNIVAIADPEVSRRHACVRLENNSFVVEDWASTNGTFVNGKRIGGLVTLYSGDEIGLGDTVILQFLAEDPSFQRTNWSQPVIDSDAETIVESNAPPSSNNEEPNTDTAPVPPPIEAHWQMEAPKVAEEDRRRNRFRRRIMGCGCGFLLLVFLCMATIFFLDAYQQGRLLYCGPIRPFFEIFLGPFGFSPVCP